MKHYIFIFLSVFIIHFKCLSDTIPYKSNSLIITQLQIDVNEFIITSNATSLVKWCQDTIFVHVMDKVYYGFYNDIQPTFVEFFSRYPITEFNSYIRYQYNQVMISIHTKDMIDNIYIIFEIDNNQRLRKIYFY